MKCVRLLGSVLLIAAICSGNALESQAQNGAKTGAKSEILGHWAAPDCANTQEALSFTRYFYLKSAPQRIELGRYTPHGVGIDHMILSLNGVKTAVMRQEDGVLRTGIPVETTTTMEWDQLILDQPLDYTNCPQTPAAIPKSLQRVLRHIDNIEEACAITSTAASRGVSQNCAGVVFKAIDDNNDNALSLIELKLGLASASLLAALAEHGTLEIAQIEIAAAQAKELADIAASLMAALDKNKDGTLDYNEAIIPSDTVGFSAFKDVLIKIGVFFPAFKLAEIKL